MDKIAKRIECHIEGSLSVYKADGKMAELMAKINRSEVEAIVSKGIQLTFKVTTEDLTRAYFNKIKEVAKKENLYLHLRLRCWRI